MRLRFVLKPDKDSTALRDGTVDLETGAVGRTTGPEVMGVALFRDRFIGVVREGHPLSQGEITLARYAAGQHIGVSRRGPDKGPVDEAMVPFGLQAGNRHYRRRLFGALALARGIRPDRLRSRTPHCRPARRHAQFPASGATPEVTVSMLWHPRLDADPAHRWLRGCVPGRLARWTDGLRVDRV